jgi:hypothetical protein
MWTRRLIYLWALCICPKEMKCHCKKESKLNRKQKINCLPRFRKTLKLSIHQKKWNSHIKKTSKTAILRMMRIIARMNNHVRRMRKPIYEGRRKE